MTNKMYLDVTVDYDGKCEDVVLFDVDGKDLTDEVSYEKVDKFMEKLVNVDHFFLSEHRTNVQIYWTDDGMDVLFRSFGEPDDGEFDVYEVLGLDPIEFEWK